MLSEKDLSILAKTMDEIEQLTSQYEELIEKYKETELTKDENIDLIKLDSSLTNYNRLAMIYEISLKQGKYEQALIYVEDFNKAWDVVNENIDHLIELNKEQASVLVNNNQDNFKDSYVSMMLIIILSFIIAIIFGIGVSV
jgi:methyl-accepting chemotaxis protein